MAQIATSNIWLLDTTAVEGLLDELQIQDKVIDYVKEASRQVAQSDDLPAFFEFCNSWQEHAKQQTAMNFPATWQALAVISSFPEAVKNHQARGVPWEITKATLADFQRDARGEYRTEEAWEFSRISWMRNHVSGNFFEIGRLQYIPGTFGYSFRVYRDSKTGEVIPFALAGRNCTEDGWLDENVHSFITRLEKRKDGIYGNAASPDDGSIAPTLKRIDLDSSVLIDDQSTVVHIHIPSCAKLDQESCDESLKMAKAFFEKYFPEINVRAFCTSTWLLDRELEKVLLPSANIVAFGRLFRPIALQNGNDKQLLERAFGDGVTWDNCVAKTSLQKTILEHHHNGGNFRSTAGFILPEDIDNDC